MNVYPTMQVLNKLILLSSSLRIAIMNVAHILQDFFIHWEGYFLN